MVKYIIKLFVNSPSIDTKKYLMNKLVLLLVFSWKVYFLFKPKEISTVKINPIAELKIGDSRNTSTRKTRVER